MLNYPQFLKQLKHNGEPVKAASPVDFYEPYLHPITVYSDQKLLYNFKLHEIQRLWYVSHSQLEKCVLMSLDPSLSKIISSQLYKYAKQIKNH